MKNRSIEDVGNGRRPISDGDVDETESIVFSNEADSDVLETMRRNMRSHGESRSIDIVT